MPELVISKPEDIKKLQGWTIEEAGMLPPPKIGIGLKISHPAAAIPVVVLITASVAMGLSGNVVVANPGLHIESKDIIEVLKEGA